MSDEIDLDLNNYELQDLLDLFKLDYNFKSDDLKRAKKMVMQTHPDKSRLPKEYFLFFSSAFKLVYSIHQFRTRGSAENSTQYVIQHEEDQSKEKLLKQIAKKPNFNKIFNELFEKHKISDEATEGGYGDWLKSNDDIDNSVATKNTMNAVFEAKKKDARSLVVQKCVFEMGNEGNGQSELVSGIPESYGSAIFSRLGYEDLRKAHVETVVPVTQEDMNERPIFSNEQDLRRHRESQNNTPLAMNEAKQYLEKQKNDDGINDVIRAFKLAKQDEEVRRVNEKWMSGFKRIGR